MIEKPLSDLTNRKQGTSLSAAQRLRRAQYDALVKSLTHTNPNFCMPIPKAGDTNTKRATGVFASV